MTSGIFEYIDATTYHEDFAGDPRASETPSLSASVAHLLLSRSPAHAKHAHPRLNLNYQREEDPKFGIGRACHQILLEGNANIVVVPENDWRKKAAQEARNLANTQLMTALLEKDYLRALEMCEAVTTQLAQMDIQPIPFTVGTPEVTLVWEDDGVACRARVDWLHEGNAVVCDLKTSKVPPKRWQKGPIYDHGYDLQAAFYLRGIKALTGVDAEWRWVLAEPEPPYQCTIVHPTAPILALGDAKAARAIELWRECLTSDRWPGYPGQMWAELPAWQEVEWLEREAMEAA